MLRRRWLLVLGLTLIVVAGIGIVTSQRGFRMRYDATTAIARPAAAIFPLLTEPEGLKQWIGGLESSVPLTEGGLRLGARSRETLLEHGRRIAMDSEVVELDPPRLIAVTLDGAGAQGLVRYTLNETPGGTTLRYECELRFRGLMALFAPFAQGPAQAKVESDLARLKALAESRALSIP